MTVKEFKEIVSKWPDLDRHGHPSEVYMTTGWCLSSEVVSVSKLNWNSDKEQGDMLIEPSDSIFPFKQLN